MTSLLCRSLAYNPPACSDELCDSVLDLAVRLFSCLQQQQQQQQQGAQRDTTDAVVHCLYACRSYLDMDRPIRLGAWQPKPEAVIRLLDMLVHCTRELVGDTAALPIAASRRLICPLAQLITECTMERTEATVLACQPLYSVVRQLLRGPLQRAAPEAIPVHMMANVAAAAWAASWMLHVVWLVHGCGDDFDMLAENCRPFCCSAVCSCLPIPPWSSSCKPPRRLCTP